MTLDDYQNKALSTAIYPEEQVIVYPTLGLSGEAGEVADKVKKVIRDNGEKFTDDKRVEIAMEVGDVLWYVATLANDLGYSLDDIALMNINKLSSRKRRDKLHGNGDNR